MPPGIQWIVIVEARKNAVTDLLDDQLFVCFPLFALPEDAARVTLHVVDVILCAIVLIICKSDREAGSNFLCIHSDSKIAIVMPAELFLNY